MKKKALILLGLLVVFAFSSCKKGSFKTTADGIIISINADGVNTTKNIRLQVINNDIIHVTATPDDHLPTDKSLIASYDSTMTSGWTATLVGNNVELKTTTLKAVVSLNTGEIKFTDLPGNIILQEQKGGGKSFTPISVDGATGYGFTQRFESPADEAFYGLGQHQSDEFNYKGKNEILYQYNTKVSIPFIVSNKNYGILWDNYSVTKFGDPRDYAQMNQFKLYDKNGKEGGLTASYIPTDKNVKIVRTENTIDYENLESVKNFPTKFPFNGSEITWEGSIQANETGVYHFKLYYAGYTKIYLDGKLLFPERWRTAWNPNTYKFIINLKTGEKHSIKLDWKPDGGISYISLKALSPVDPIKQNQLIFSSEMGKEMNYYFIRGNSMDDVVSGYRTVTGKAQVMPKWAMGFWQSRERYKTQDELVNIVKEYRKRQIPLDNIVQDWFYWPENAWGSHDFDSTRYPNPKKMVDDVHALHAHIMISVWPKFYVNTDNYKAMDAHGWMFHQSVKDSVKDWVGKGYVASFYDAYSAGARKLFWDMMNKKLYSKGFDAWWMDASEPDVNSNSSMEYRKALMNPTALGPSTEYFNAYGMMNAKGIYEGQRSTNDSSRVFLLTRSGFAGSQKYAAAIWSGDIGTRWEDMKAQISAGLNFAIAGNPYWTMDDGGFCVENRYANAKDGSEDQNEWRELNVRWHQFGSFAPLFRSHGQFPYREAWNIAPDNNPAYKTMVYYTKLRYRLMPYIYTLAGMAYFDDYTIMRPLVMNYGQDTKVLNVGDQYMFGPSLMVCPVYTYKARMRSVYFPTHITWYDIYTGKSIEGGQCMDVVAPYDKMPVYAAAGSIIPMGKVIEDTEEEQKDLSIYIYAGKDGTFSLYNDDGTTYGYEKGAFATIHFTYNDKDKTLTIGAREGSFPTMIKDRKFKLFFVTKDNAISIDGTAVSKNIINYNGLEKVVKL